MGACTSEIFMIEMIHFMNMQINYTWPWIPEGFYEHFMNYDNFTK